MLRLYILIASSLFALSACSERKRHIDSAPQSAAHNAPSCTTPGDVSWYVAAKYSNGGFLDFTMCAKPHPQFQSVPADAADLDARATQEIAAGAEKLTIVAVFPIAQSQ